MKKRLYERDCKVNDNKRVNESEEIDRQAFGSLIRYGDKPYDGYAILNDGYFVKRIYAESDEDAKKQFQDWLNRGGTSELHESVYNIFYDTDDSKNNKEEFYGSWFELQEYIKDMRKNGLYNIDAVFVQDEDPYFADHDDVGKITFTMYGINGDGDGVFYDDTPDQEYHFVSKETMESKDVDKIKQELADSYGCHVDYVEVKDLDIMDAEEIVVEPDDLDLVIDDDIEEE